MKRIDIIITKTIIATFVIIIGGGGLLFWISSSSKGNPTKNLFPLLGLPLWRTSSSMYHHPNKKKIQVSCVGDSITARGCASSRNMTYVAQLQQMLGGSKYNVENFGVSGNTMLKEGCCSCSSSKNNGTAIQCDGRNCSYWRSQAFSKALQSQPDIVTIMLGTNDAKGCNWYGPANGSPKGMGVEFRSAYLDMISQFKSLPSQPKVFLLIPPPLVNPPLKPSRPPPFDMKKEIINERFPTIIRSIGDEAGVDGIIDIWTALGGEQGYAHVEMTCDGCHPKDHAMTIIAKTIAKRIAATTATTTTTPTTTTTTTSSFSKKENEKEEY